MYNYYFSQGFCIEFQFKISFLFKNWHFQYNFKGILNVHKCKNYAFHYLFFYLITCFIFFLQMLGVFWACPFKKEKLNCNLYADFFFWVSPSAKYLGICYFFPFWIIFHISAYEEEFKSQYVMDKASEAKLCANYSNCSQILQGCYFIVVLYFRLYDNVILSFNQCFCLLQLFHSWFKSSWTYDCL